MTFKLVFGRKKQISTHEIIELLTRFSTFMQQKTSY